MISDEQDAVTSLHCHSELAGRGATGLVDNYPVEDVLNYPGGAIADTHQGPRYDRSSLS